MLQPLLFTSLASSLPLVPRDTSKILLDISTIGSDVTSLTTDVSSFNGSSYQTAPLLQGFEDLKFDITTTTSDVEAAGSFDENDSSSISSAVSDITSSVINLLVDLMGKVGSLH